MKKLHIICLCNFIYLFPLTAAEPAADTFQSTKTVEAATASSPSPFDYSASLASPVHPISPAPPDPAAPIPAPSSLEAREGSVLCMHVIPTYATMLLFLDILLSSELEAI